MNENDLSAIIVDCCFKVHTTLGPGLLESVYESVLCYELQKRGLSVRKQVEIPVIYEGMRLETGFRADVIVEDLVIIEIKSIEAIASVHSKQVLAYLRLCGMHLGMLVNFNVALIKDGIKRIVNHL